MDYITPFIKWLLKSDYIKSKKIFLNAVQAKENNLQIITQQIAENQIKKFVDDSKSYPITFNITNFKSASYNPLVKTKPESDENLTDILDVSKIIKFVNKMNEQGIYPEFAENITVENIYCQYNTPSTPVFDGTVSPSLAKFIIPIVCEVYEDAET